MRLLVSLLAALATLLWMLRAVRGPRLTQDREHYDRDAVTDATRRRYQ